MTKLEELEAMEKAVLTCAEVAPVLGENPHELHMTAIEHPEWLQFPVIRKTKTRVVFPRLPFLETTISYVYERDSE